MYDNKTIIAYYILYPDTKNIILLIFYNIDNLLYICAITEVRRIYCAINSYKHNLLVPQLILTAF